MKYGKFFNIIFNIHNSNSAIPNNNNTHPHIETNTISHMVCSPEAGIVYTGKIRANRIQTPSLTNSSFWALKFVSASIAFFILPHLRDVLPQLNQIQFVGHSSTYTGQSQPDSSPCHMRSTQLIIEFS